MLEITEIFESSIEIVELNGNIPSLHEKEYQKEILTHMEHVQSVWKTSILRNRYQWCGPC